MLTKKMKEVGTPLVYIFLSLGISCIYYGINKEYKGLAIFIVALFFICIFYYCGASFTCIISFIFIIGIFINFSYYKIDNEINGEVRIINISNYSIIGEYKGKNISLKTKIKNLCIGEKYKIIGKTKKIEDKYNGIVGEVSPKILKKIDGDFITRLYDFKRKIYSKLEENLGKRKAGLLSSIAFGYSDYLDSEDQEDMKNYGIIHSISVSGLHVALIYCFLRIFMGSKLGLLSTIIYVIFTGSSYPCIRAFVMIACIEIGRILKRNNSSISALCLSAIILVIYQPYCIFNISFHLSYLAALGIIMFYRKFNDILYKLHTRLREPLSLTLSAQIFTLPYLVMIFKDFSANFIIGNLLLAPFLDIMVITGNILALSYISPELFDFFSYVNLIIIKVFDWILNVIDKFSLPIFYGNEYIVFLYLFIMLSFYMIKKGSRKFVYLPLISILIIAIEIYSPIPSISYYKEGAILVSYKGERILIANKNQIDIKRLSKATLATKYYRDGNFLNIDGICNIRLYGKNYILVTPKEKYLLKVTKSKNQGKEYDIINFENKINNKIFIINGNVL